MKPKVKPRSRRRFRSAHVDAMTEALHDGLVHIQRTTTTAGINAGLPPGKEDDSTHGYFIQIIYLITVIIFSSLD